MHPSRSLSFAALPRLKFLDTHTLLSVPIVHVSNGTFYHRHPSSSLPSEQDTRPNPALFPNLNFSLPSFASPNQHWAVLSPSSSHQTSFLQILRGRLLCFPATARTFPYLQLPEIAEKNQRLRLPERAIEYVGFDVERKGFGGAYLSARYESLREDTDFTVQRYLTGITTMNPGEEELKAKSLNPDVVRRVMRDLELERFLDKPVNMLSHGQSRRARIAKALLGLPEVLCLDAPFIGLDPVVTMHISDLLYRLAEANAPRIVLSLRPQDTVPSWITHFVHIDEHGNVETSGAKQAGHYFSQPQSAQSTSEPTKLSRDGYEMIDKARISIGEPVVEMDGVRIAYGENAIIGDWQQEVNGTLQTGLHWRVHRGQRWGIFGGNGSGKTTLLSLVTSDHPQTYAAPIKLFQRSRLPPSGQRGVTIFEIQSRLGHASPEVHGLFPKQLSLRRTLETAWSDTPITRPRLDDLATKQVDACLRWFEPDLRSGLEAERREGNDLHWATQISFDQVSFSAQRVLLFLRAIIKIPDVVILDEAFSGMDDAARDKCLLFLSQGQTVKLCPGKTGPVLVDNAMANGDEVVMPGLRDHQVLLCVSHSRLEVPGCIRQWICLPEPGSGPARFGTLDGPVELDERRWSQIWGW